MKGMKNICDFIEENIVYLRENKGIMLLDDLSDDEMFLIVSNAYLYPELDAREIYFDDKKYLLLRYKIIGKSNKESINEIKDVAYNAYHNQEYELCINNFLLILAAFEEPKAIYYAKLGFSYVRTGEIKKGIDYLMVATYLSDGEWDYTDYINELKKLDNYKNYFRLDKGLSRKRVSLSC